MTNDAHEPHPKSLAGMRERANTRAEPLRQAALQAGQGAEYFYDLSQNHWLREEAGEDKGLGRLPDSKLLGEIMVREAYADDMRLEYFSIEERAAAELKYKEQSAIVEGYKPKP